MRLTPAACVTILALIATLAAGGCGAKAPVFPGVPAGGAPHGGTLVALPGGRGFAEIVNAPTTIERGRTSRPNSEVAVYFLEPALTAPFSPAPTGVSLTVEQPEGRQTVPLSPADSRAKSPGAAAAREGAYVSKPGPYTGSLSGDLNATLGGEAVTVPFVIR